MSLPLFLAVALVLSYPPADYVREQTFDSPEHTFCVESWRKESQGTDAALCLWVVAPDNTTAKLLVPPGALTPLYSAEVRISPDERWILWEEKLYHGANAYGLFERVSGLLFREVGQLRFDKQAWGFMSQQVHRRFKLEDTTHIMRVSDWPAPGSRVRKLALYGDAQPTPVTAPNDQSLAISLYGDDRKSLVDLWFCFYDLRRQCFYLNPALEKHNNGRVCRSRGR